MAKKAGKATTKKPVASSKRMPTKGTKRKAVPPVAPRPVRTGKGPDPAAIGNDLVALFNRGNWQEIEEKYHSPKIVSIEGMGVSMAWHGKAGVQQKSEQWMSTHRVHGASAEGPYVGATGFAVKFTMDVEDTAANSRVMMEEVGVYTVANGKIISEEFMYGRVTPVSPTT